MKFTSFLVFVTRLFYFFCHCFCFCDPFFPWLLLVQSMTNDDGKTNETVKSTIPTSDIIEEQRQLWCFAC